MPQLTSDDTMALVAASSAACIVANLELPLELSETQLRLLENGRQSAAHETRFVTNSSRGWRAVRHLNPIVGNAGDDIVEIIPEPVVAYLARLACAARGAAQSTAVMQMRALRAREGQGTVHCIPPLRPRPEISYFSYTAPKQAASIS